MNKKIFIIEYPLCVEGSSTEVVVIDLDEVWEAVWKSLSKTHDLSPDIDENKDTFMDNYYEILEEDFVISGPIGKYVMVPYSEELEIMFKGMGWIRNDQ